MPRNEGPLKLENREEVHLEASEGPALRTPGPQLGEISAGLLSSGTDVGVCAVVNH